MHFERAENWKKMREHIGVQMYVDIQTHTSICSCEAFKNKKH